MLWGTKLVKIHIFGASGSGTTTLAKALCDEICWTHLDTDDYFWLTKYTEIRELEEMMILIRK